MRVSSLVVVVEVSLEDILTVTGVGPLERDALVEDLMNFGKIMLWLIWRNGNGFQGGKSGVDEVEVQEVAGVEAPETPDEATNAEITKEEEAGEVATADGADGRGGDGWVQADEDTAKLWESEAGSLGSEGSVAAHDWGCDADTGDIHCGEEIPGKVDHEVWNWLTASGGFTSEAQAPVRACLKAMGWPSAWRGVGDPLVDEEGDRAAYVAMEDSSGL